MEAQANDSTTRKPPSTLARKLKFGLGLTLGLGLAAWAWLRRRRH